MQTILATALVRLGRSGEAAPIIEKWQRAGYAHPDFIAISEHEAATVADGRPSSPRH
jgi:hypothetical protein